MLTYEQNVIAAWRLQAARQNAGTLQPLQKAAIRSTMRQLAHVLAFTHQQGITHRDVKPENVLLQDNGNIALCDFGISKDIISGAYESTLNLSAAGTLAYCAPEAGLVTSCLFTGLKFIDQLTLPNKAQINAYNGSLCLHMLTGVIVLLGHANLYVCHKLHTSAEAGSCCTPPVRCILNWTEHRRHDMYK